jgi:hypothetical protein
LFRISIFALQIYQFCGGVHGRASTIASACAFLSKKGCDLGIASIVSTCLVRGKKFLEFWVSCRQVHAEMIDFSLFFAVDKE